MAGLFHNLIKRHRHEANLPATGRQLNGKAQLLRVCSMPYSIRSQPLDPRAVVLPPAEVEFDQRWAQGQNYGLTQGQTRGSSRSVSFDR